MAPDQVEPGAEEEGLAGPGRARMVPPRWVPLTTTILCLLALADSAYLTYAHYTTATVLACPSNPKSVVDCALVTQSSYSHPFGIPVVIPGCIWCVAMLALCSPWGWRAASVWFSRLRVAGAVAGVGMVFWLVWAELKLRHICEYCTGVHILTVALFIVILFATALSVPAVDETELGLDEAP